MPKMNLTITHALSQEEAMTRVTTLLPELKRQHGDKISNLQERWSGNRCDFSFSAMGFGVSGDITVQSDSIVLNGSLPFAASFFKGKIEETIRAKAKEVLR